MSDGILSRAHDLALSVAPELSASPLYMLRAGDYPMLRGVDAYAPHRITAVWRSRLENIIQWRGNGQLVILGNSVAQMTREETLGVVLHECCHLLPHCEPLDCPEPTLEAIRASLTHASELSLTDNPAATASPWGVWHGADFHRIACHVWARAWTLGYHLHPDSLRAGDFFGLPKLGVFVQSLGDELRTMADLPFQEILQAPMPPMFAWLWDDTTKEI